MTTRAFVAVVCTTGLFGAPINAQNDRTQNDRIHNPHHLDAKDIPEEWRNFRGDPYLYLPVPPDPPDAARGAELMNPSKQSEPIGIAVGDKVRLDPAALKDGWRIDGASPNLLVPLTGAPRVFLARCPGKAEIDFVRGPVHAPTIPPPLPRPGFLQRDVHRVALQIRDLTPPTPGCTEYDLAPRTPNPGQLTIRHAGHLVEMKVGDEVILVPHGSCIESWRHFALSKSDLGHEPSMPFYFEVQ